MDWMQPGSTALGRIPDSRVRQFWDPNHMVAGALNEIVKQKPPVAEPDCCSRKGFYWDEAILYSRGAHWREDASASVFWNGPVFRTVAGLEKAWNGQR